MADERYVEEEFTKTREALDDAESLAESGGSDAGVVKTLLGRTRAFVDATASTLDTEVVD